ncbi:MAG: hypothetical protein IT249_10035 [Chitinophagaceae bacterium]|nr:hypothetical protein [Chitinophagaceae bacterium]
MDYTKVTDDLFEVLESGLLAGILERMQAMGADLAALPHDKAREELRQQRHTEINDFAANCLAKALPGIAPEATPWFKDEPQPTSEWQWILCPFTSNLMGKTYTGIALAQNNQPRIGLYVDYGEGAVTTGVEGEGAFCNDIQYLCGNKILNAQSRVMQFIIPPGKPGRQYIKLIKSLWNTTDCKMLNNVVAQNIAAYMISVAKGTQELVIATGFSYHDIAAAVCIAEQAGAVVTDFNGTREKLFTGEEMICCNKRIAEQIKKVEADTNGADFF